jgi:hypothetical protein
MLRGIFATAYGSDVDGSGAPISGRLRRRCFLALQLTVVVSVLGMGVGVSGASAVQPLSTIGIIGKCCHEGVLGEYYYANSLDINKKTGDLYLLDPNNSHVLVFDSNGNYKFTFGSEGTGAGQLGKYSSVGISVDQTSGDVYVSESGGPLANNRISKFSETGEFILTFGRRVNETTLGDVCTKASGDVCQPGSNEGERAIVNSIAAVDPDTGNVYIPSNGKTSIYAPNGKYIETIETPGVVNQVAIFNEIIYQQTSSGFKTYSNTGTPLGEIIVPAFQEFSPVGMVPAPGSEQPGETHLYVMMINNATGKTEVGEFNSSGKLLIEHGIGMPYPTQGSIAVDPSIPHIYVGTFPNDPFGGPAIILGIPETVPVVALKPPTEIAARSVTLNGSVNPEGTTLKTFWHFEYRRAGTIPWTASPQPPIDIGNGTTAVDASQGITELIPNTFYEYRLVGSREFGGGTTTSAIAKVKTGFEEPKISVVAPSHITDTEATIQGMVDPENSPATYYFEWGKTTAYGERAPVEGEGDAGSQYGPGGVFEHLRELEPSTTYHFRLVATNPAGTVTGGDHEFTTYSTADEVWAPRDIELVNNPDDGNQETLPILQEESVSPDGSEVLWATPSGSPQSYTGFGQLYLSKRDTTTPTGWTSLPFGVPASQQVHGGDSSYIASAASRDFSTVVFYTTDCFEIGLGFCDHTFVRVTKSGEQEILADPGVPKLSAISVSDDGQWVNYFNPRTKQSISHQAGGQDHILPTPACGYEVPPTRYSNVSLGSLSRVFVQSNGLSEPCEEPGIYMIDRETSSITKISSGGNFIRTNEDGTRVIYQRVDGEYPNEERNFYEWKDGAGATCLTCGEMPPVVAGYGIENVTVSEDLSHVYFFARKPFSEGGSCAVGRMFVIHHEQVDFVAEDGVGGCVGDYNFQTTRDGNSFVFLSNLTGTTADDTGLRLKPSGEAANNAIQVYRYDDETGYTECVSCRGTTEPATGGVSNGFGAATSLSDDGSTVGFATEAALVPEDINGSTDVYEWHNGVTRLVTNGEVEFEGFLAQPDLWGASEDGKTLVFSAATVALTGHETHKYGNVYAAVVGGPGFPPPNPPAHCTEDACQGPLQPSPPLDFQGSSAFHGPGSPAPKRGKGKKHRHKKHHHKKKKKNHRGNSTGRQG